MTEEELARLVVEWLSSAGWEVYQEVADDIRASHRRWVADIVAVRGSGSSRKYWVVEVKRQVGIRVMAQAERWLRRANMVSIATLPGCKDEAFVKRVLDMLGIGWICVRGYEGGVRWCSEALQPKERVGNGCQWFEGRLLEQQKTFCAAGVAGGGYYTDFKATVARLREYVGKHPGCKLGQAMREVPNHYKTLASAVGSLRHWIAAGKVPGLALGDGGILLLKEE